MKKQKITVLLLLALLTVIGCTDAKSSPDNKTDDGSTATAPITTETAAQDTEKLSYAYPEADYEGYEFVFLNVEPQGWANALIAPEESTGESINDALFERNVRIEDRYHVKISEYKQGMDSVAAQLRRTVSANEDTYDVCMLPIHSASGIMAENYLIDLKSVDSLHLDMPWWDQMVNQSLTIMDKLYMTSGDISLFPFEATWGIFFNEDIMRSLDLPLPYDLVKDGKWTLDRLTEYAKEGALLGTDSAYLPFSPSGTARYGLCSHHDLPIGLIQGAGCSIVTIENNQPVFHADEERMINLYDKIAALTGEKGAYYDWDFGLQVEGYEMFMNGRFMMWSETLGYLSQLRSMEDNFGVVPFPKYDETQESYHSIVATWGTTMTTIPTTASDVTRTGVILDALAYDSYENLMEPYYNTYLMQKGARNENSAEMLSIIRNTRIIAADMALGWSSDLCYAIRDKLSTGTSEILSMIESQKKNTIEKANKLLQVIAE
ncbi:MAG: extracellular solute-binding protein [Clostridia bacterium]|nr:extracellular solute-binding protein [Clostridia bacterium]